MLECSVWGICLFFIWVGFSLSVFYSHPLVLGMGLLIITVVMGMIVCYYGPVFSFCVFMVMVAGVLVVFSYTISLVPYEGSDIKKSKKVGINISISPSYKVFGSWVVLVFFFLVCIVSVGVNSVYSEDFSSMFLNYSEIVYFTEDYSIVIVWLAVLLFLAMVFGASMSSWYKGALVL
uniref:NADH dehydrogenase subunit 6 n=1 Tax=Meretrix lamarckii TaxID=157363 RepID=A0A0U2A0F7_9BIVA|nr:NADH dehydrogenase subunit 6 [Meretrix lamarckii]